jgi:Ras-related protein Rab-5C
MSREGDLKVVLIGSASVGKTCIVERATVGYYDEQILPTLGASYTSKTVRYEGRAVTLQIWDTAGQERYRGVTPMYYRSAAAALVVYSVMNRESFDEIDQWIASFHEYTTGGAIFVVANKLDLEDERAVTEAEGRSKALANKAFFCEVSAKTGEGIVELFHKIPEGIDALHAERMKEQGIFTYEAPQPRQPDPGCKC